MNNFIPDFMEILTEEGWVPLNQYNSKNRVLLLNSNYRTGYLKPKVVSKRDFKGSLLELTTESMTLYLKPSSKILVNDTLVKAKDIKKGDKLNKRYVWNKVEKIDAGEWEGRLFSLFFGEDLLMPIKFEFDYCLLSV